MKVLAIVPCIYDRSPGQRFRLEQWEPYLRENEVEVTYAPFEDEELSKVVHTPGRFREKIGLAVNAFVRRWGDMQRLNEFDIIYVFREAALFGPAFFERIIHRADKPMVFDFDDAIYLRSEGSLNGYLNYLKLPGKTKSICRLATHVMAGNPLLAEYAGQVNENITVIPTTIDTRKYTVVEKIEEKPLTIGWSGSFSTVLHLNTLRDALQKLARQREFKLRVIGTPRYELEGVQVEALQWNSATELADLREIDIGIMPLPNNMWSRGKCGLKALQYMALGIPTMCSPVGVNSEIIEDGENGFLAATNDEWIEKLCRLLDSAKLRRDIGIKGRQTVEERFSAEAQVPRVLEVLRKTLSRQKSKKGQKI